MSLGKIVLVRNGANNNVYYNILVDYDSSANRYSVQCFSGANGNTDQGTKYFATYDEAVNFAHDRKAKKLNSGKGYRVRTSEGFNGDPMAQVKKKLKTAIPSRNIETRLPIPASTGASINDWL